MNTTEIPAQSGPDLTQGFRFTHWSAVRWIALAVYFSALIVWSSQYGVPVQRELVIAWVCGALVCASLGHPPAQVLQMVLDWLPIVVVFFAYDFTRGAADSLGIGVHTHPMIDFDRFVFLGETPTEWLQARLYDPDRVNWWDVVFTITYTSYFIVPFTLAGLLWVRDRLQFLRFTKRLVTLALAGLTTYCLFPAAPPWMAGENGLIGEVARTTGDGWQVLGVGTASLFDKGQDSVNLVAAVPSLHSGFTMLVAIFMWPRVRPWIRPLLLLYPLAMGLTLIASGEHYFFDVLLGWIYAWTVMAGWSVWERRKALRVSEGVRPGHCCPCEERVSAQGRP